MKISSLEKKTILFAINSGWSCQTAIPAGLVLIGVLSMVNYIFRAAFIECCKTRNKVMTLTNHNRPKHWNEPIRTCIRRKARENASVQVAIGIVLAFLIG